MATSPVKTEINGTVSKPPLASLASWVRLNVGGTVFATTVTTLAKDPDSFLYRICRTDDKDYLDSHKVRYCGFTYCYMWSSNSRFAAFCNQQEVVKTFLFYEIKSH